MEGMNERLTVLVVDDELPVLITAAAVLSEDFRVLGERFLQLPIATVEQVSIADLELAAA